MKTTTTIVIVLMDMTVMEKLITTSTMDTIAPSILKKFMTSEMSTSWEKTVVRIATPNPTGRTSARWSVSNARKWDTILGTVQKRRLVLGPSQLNSERDMCFL